MTPKLPMLRPAVITTAALVIGTTAGAIAQYVAAHLGCQQLAIGEFTTAIIASWVLDMLNNFIGGAMSRQDRLLDGTQLLAPR